MLGFLGLSVIYGASWSSALEPVGRHLWICPVVATSGLKDVNGATPIVWAGDYVFDITTDGGIHGTKLLNDLKAFGGGGVLLSGAKFKGDVNRPLAFRRVNLVGNRMTIVRGDGEEVTIELKTGENYFRRTLYPVEPSEKNDWTGWPS